jgi:hypothetical protein
MTTDISVSTTSYQSENRAWLLSPHGTETTPSITLDVSAFTANTHYPNGYLLSGIPLGIITATGKAAPYVDANSDGTQTCVGLLFSSVKVPNLLDLTVDVGGAMLIHGFVSASKLPIAVDAAGKVDLKLIHFAA